MPLPKDEAGLEARLLDAIAALREIHAALRAACQLADGYEADRAIRLLLRTARDRADVAVREAVT